MNWMNIRLWGRGILFGIGALIFAALIALLFGWVLMLLWNWLMPELFNLPAISYWQGWGLILLSHLLFKGGGGHGGVPRHHRFPLGGRGFSGRSGEFHGRPDREGMDDFKREFRHHMRQRWHEHAGCEPEGKELKKSEEE